MALFLLHCESMTMCLILMVLLLFMELSTRRDKAWRKYIPPLYVCVMVQLILDGVWFIINGYQEYIILQKCIQTLYLCIYPLIGWLWFEYCSQTFHSFKLLKSKAFHKLLLIPLALNVIIVLFSWNNGIIYVVDSTGTYLRGPWMIFTNGISYSLMIISGILSWIEAGRAKTSSEKRALIGQGFYIIPPFIMGVAQLSCSPGVTCVYFGFVISFALFFIDSLRAQITQDSMTGLLNHNTIDKKIYDAVSHWKKNDILFLVICDLDRFKSINDTYGHTVGDQAIVQAGHVIESVCKSSEVLASRIHGDEFVLLAEGKEEAAIERMMGIISEQLREESEEYPYTLEASWGTAQYVQGMSVKSLFEIADWNLYQNKRLKYAPDSARQG